MSVKVEPYTSIGELLQGLVKDPVWFTCRMVTLRYRNKLIDRETYAVTSMSLSRFDVSPTTFSKTKRLFYCIHLRPVNGTGVHPLLRGGPRNLSVEQEGTKRQKKCCVLREEGERLSEEKDGEDPSRRT